MYERREYEGIEIKKQPDEHLVRSKELLSISGC